MLFRSRRAPPFALLKETDSSYWRHVSKHTGDKARFHRIRKQNTARRQMVRELRQRLSLAVAPAPAPAAATVTHTRTAV